MVESVMAPQRAAAAGTAAYECGRGQRGQQGLPCDARAQRNSARACMIAPMNGNQGHHRDTQKFLMRESMRRASARFCGTPSNPTAAEQVSRSAWRVLV
jgi:hypothetical protein